MSRTQGETDRTVRVLLADDHNIVRAGLRALLEAHDGIQVIGEAKDGWTTLALARTLKPDVVVMDIGMPELNGIEATRQILTELPDVKVIALSVHSDRRFVAEMLRAGAAGYLLKEGSFEELAQAIRTVVANETYLCSRIAKIVVENYVRRLPVSESSVFSVLTEREREVLQLLAEGRTTKQIACRLRLSMKTVETYRRQIMERLKIRSIAELTKYAIREGLTPLDS